MEIVSVADGYEQMFWNYVNRDPINYYFSCLIGLSAGSRRRYSWQLKKETIGLNE